MLVFVEDARQIVAEIAKKKTKLPKTLEYLRVLMSQFARIFGNPNETAQKSQ